MRSRLIGYNLNRRKGINMARTLYCLKLVGGRFYVGQTPVGRFKRRLYEHRFLKGALWTSRFPVVDVVWTRTVSENFIQEEEDKACCFIMRLRGINACRGGLFNIARDVRKLPKWVQPVYRVYEHEIMKATVK